MAESQTLVPEVQGSSADHCTSSRTLPAMNRGCSLVVAYDVLLIITYYYYYLALEILSNIGNVDSNKFP